MTGGLEQKSAAAGVETPVRGGLPGIEAADIEEEKPAPQTEAPAAPQGGLPGAAPQGGLQASAAQGAAEEEHVSAPVEGGSAVSESAADVRAQIAAKAEPAPAGEQGLVTVKTENAPAAVPQGTDAPAAAQGAAQRPQWLRTAGLVCKIVLAVLAGLLLLYDAYMIAARLSGKPMPRFLGVASAVVVSGSMEPEIGVGDFIVTAARSEYEVGDIVTYIGPDGVSTTHRIVAKFGQQYVVQGDANNAQDNFTVPPSAVVGRVVAVLRGFGRVIGFLQTPVGLLSIVAFAAAVWGLFALGSYLLRRRAAPEQTAAENTSEQIAAENAAAAERSARSAAAENAAEQAAAENAAPQNETERNTLRGGRAGD